MGFPEGPIPLTFTKQVEPKGDVDGLSPISDNPGGDPYKLIITFNIQKMSDDWWKCTIEPDSISIGRILQLQDPAELFDGSDDPKKDQFWSKNLLVVLVPGGERLQALRFNHIYLRTTSDGSSMAKVQIQTEQVLKCILTTDNWRDNRDG